MNFVRKSESHGTRSVVGVPELGEIVSMGSGFRIQMKDPGSLGALERMA